jgi:hypothetical protein
MDDNIAIFLVLIVSMAAALVLVLSTLWMRRSRPLVAQAGEDIALLCQENDVLREQVRGLEQRLGAVERTVTEALPRLTREDAALRLQNN